MHMGRGASAAGSRRHQRRKEAFPARPTDRRRIFSGRRRVGETVSGTASREKPAGERERRPDRRSVLRRVRKTARHADSPGRRSGSLRLFGRPVRPAPGFRNGDSENRVANSCIRSVVAGILRFPARRTAAGRACRPTVPETVTPHLEKPCAEKKSRRAGVPTAKRWSGCGPCWCTASTKATPWRSSAPGWAVGEVVVKESSLAAFERPVPGANSVAGAVAGAGGSARPRHGQERRRWLKRA